MATAPVEPTPGPDVPNRGDRATFSQRVGDWITWFTTVIIAELYGLAQNVYANALEAMSAAAVAEDAAFAAYNAQGTNANSTTEQAIGIGEMTLEVEINKDYVPGQYITRAYRASPANLMCGTVLTYDDTTGELVMQVDYYQGAGTYADWALSMAVRPRNEPPSVEITTDTTAVVGVEYTLMAECDLILPAGAPVGSMVYIVNLSGTDQCWVKRADVADKIEDKVEDQRLNRKRAQGVIRKYATKGWCWV